MIGCVSWKKQYEERVRGTKKRASFYRGPSCIKALPAFKTVLMLS
jgi:hypothetical protein